MLMLGPIGFGAPWLLAALVALPVLWFLLRAVPPAPIRRRFPGVALLLGLRDDDAQTDRTPWWLLALRIVAVAALITGLAGPVLNPEVAPEGAGPLLIVEDGSWASARDWPRRSARIADLLEEAGRSGRPVALVSLTDLPPAPAAPPPGGAGGETPGGANANMATPDASTTETVEASPAFGAADDVAAGLAGLIPRAWEPEGAAVAAWAGGLQGAFDTWWLSDGLDRPGRADLAAALAARGRVTVIESPRPVLALPPPALTPEGLEVTVLRSPPAAPATAEVVARGPDPAGIDRELARVSVPIAAGAPGATVPLPLPPEIRNRITRLEIEGQRQAGAVSLADDGLRRKEVALVAGRADREGLELLSPLHYLRQALQPSADLIEGSLAEVLPANPDVLVMADVARITGPDRAALTAWVEGGGLLVRFAGTQLAASDVARAEDDPLLPVRLRAGGRSVGGAMSWDRARGIAPFAEGTPFHGLAVPEEVTVSAQVLAQPGPDLAGRTIAALADGTPLVTRRNLGAGQVVLFHVTANAEWSGLPLSGLFVQMLDRLAVSARGTPPVAEDLAGTTWVADTLIDGFGALSRAETQAGVPGEVLAAGLPGPALPPGLYAGEGRRIAVNAVAAGRALGPAVWPAGVTVTGLAASAAVPLGGALLGLALGLMLADALAALALSGRLARRRGGMAPAVLALLLAGFGAPGGLAVGLTGGLAAGLAGAARAQTADAPAPAQAPAAPASALPPDDTLALAASNAVVLAHVLTGDAEVDRIAAAGLLGLSDQLFGRTAVEPAEPMGVDLERDNLAFFPFLYWPITDTQPQPSDAAYARLNDYLRSGGMILFDTRDGDIAGYGGGSANARRLQELAAPLDIPPLAPMPPDHVLTRAFYLLQDFPGRYAGPGVWVEAAPEGAEQAEGMPFRNLNDGVTPVVIGGNDWAAAWAIDRDGVPMFPVGRGFAGERQREMAFRFGVNLIMHVLTGNYKSDQVHVPALLERLGQ